MLSKFVFLSLLFFLKINFLKNLSGIDKVWIKFSPNVLSGLSWVQTVCKVYKQPTLTGKKLNNNNILNMLSNH